MAAKKAIQRVAYRVDQKVSLKVGPMAVSTV